MDNQPNFDKETIVALGTDLRIGRAAEIFDMLELAASTSKIVVIDGAETNKIDAAGLQALAAAIVRFRTAGTLWRWQNKSFILIDAAKILGLEGALELK